MVWRAVLTRILLILLATQLLFAESLQRIRQTVNDYVRTYILGQIHPLARPQWDIGRAPARLSINGASLVFKRSAQQELDLKQLLAQQENPASALYHHRLSPQQFADRFGVSSDDRRKVEDWLRLEGLTVDEQASSATSIQFSGTVASMERAFGTEFHIFRIQGSDYLANAYELSVPVAMAAVVDGFCNLDTFRPHAKVRSAFRVSLNSIKKWHDGQVTPFDLVNSPRRVNTSMTNGECRKRRSPIGLSRE